MGAMKAEDLEQRHPYLPDDWSRGMATIKAHGGPWWCKGCDGVSYLIYRCSQCGHDLTADG